MSNLRQDTVAPNQGQTSSSKKKSSSENTVTQQAIAGGKDQPQAQEISVQIVPQIIRDNKAEKAFKVRVSLSDCIQRLKKIVEEKNPHYAANIQDLSYDRKWLEDNNTVGSYGILKGSKIFLRVKIRLNIVDGNGRPCNTLPEVIVYDTITLNDLKTRLNSITSNQPRRRFSCNQLNLDNKNPDTPLWAIGIGDNDKITVY